MSEGREGKRTALFIAAFDSQAKWCAHVIPAFEHRGFDCRVVIPDLRTALSPGQLQAAGIGHTEQLSWERLVEAALATDVVVCALSGPYVRRFVLDLEAARPMRWPVLVSGWVGVIIEKQVTGYLDRSSTDVIAVNSRSDFDAFVRAASALALPADNLLLAGLPYLPSRPVPERDGAVRQVVFADQPTIPEDRAERLYLYERLVAYADRHPQRKVILKPRHAPGERTFHRGSHHPEKLLRGVARPANFSIAYDPIPALLPSTDLLLTVSSSACLEAIAVGCRVALLADQGVHDRYGNHIFTESGLLRSFDQVDADDIGTPRPEWLANYFAGTATSPGEAIATRAIELLDSGLRPSGPVRETPFFRGMATFEAQMAASRAAMSGAALLGRKRGPLMRAILRGGYDLVPPSLVEPAKRVLRALRIL
jgi:hypothetical protein